MDGGYDLERCAEVTERVLTTVFMQLYEARAFLEGIVLKPNMVVSGSKHPKRASPEEVAQATVRVLKSCVPAAVPGIAFLSGGQSEVEATANLDAISGLGGPWALTFTYGRALQAAAQQDWAGKGQNIYAAQAAFVHRARDHQAFKPWRIQALAFKAIRRLYPDHPLWRDFAYEYEQGKVAIDVINGGPLLRAWVDDASATPRDLDTLAARCSARVKRSFVMRRGNLTGGLCPNDGKNIAPRHRPIVQCQQRAKSRPRRRPRLRTRSENGNHLCGLRVIWGIPA
jgi:hypothetical protein